MSTVKTAAKRFLRLSELKDNLYYDFSYIYCIKLIFTL